MIIGQIQSIGVNEMSKVYSTNRKNRLEIAPKRISSDTYEPSNENIPDENRSKLLSDVRNRIKSGYYNSSDVIDDLGESFAKVFEKSL